MTPLRLACVLAVVVAAVGPAAASGSQPPQATTARACGTLKLGVGQSIVRSRNVRCADARRFIGSYLNRDCGETKDCSATRVTYRGYRCVTRESATLTKNTCTMGRKVISELHG